MEFYGFKWLYGARSCFVINLSSNTMVECMYVNIIDASRAIGQLEQAPLKGQGRYGIINGHSLPMSYFDNKADYFDIT